MLALFLSSLQWAYSKSVLISNYCSSLLSWPLSDLFTWWLSLKKMICYFFTLKPSLAVHWLQNKIQIPELSIQSHSQCAPNGASLTPRLLLPLFLSWNQPHVFHTLSFPATCSWHSQNFHVSRLANVCPTAENGTNLYLSENPGQMSKLW